MNKNCMKIRIGILLSILIVGTMLTSCKDDELETINHDDNTETGPPAVDLPTHDVIETIVTAQTAIFATGLDEMSSLFQNRLSGENISTSLSDDTELVILDEDGAALFINDSEKYEAIEDFYLRGGLIYFHKPALQASALIARLELEVFNTVPDDVIPPVCDAYIFNIQGAEYRVDDIHSTGSQIIEFTDEAGNIQTVVVDDAERPSDYLYGLYAESAAKFVNEVLETCVRARSTTVTLWAGASFTEPPLIPIQWDKTLYLRKTYGKGAKGHHMAKDVSLMAEGIVSVNAKIRCAYSFDQDKDYYQITLNESYPGSLFWKGENKIHYKAAYYDKYGGFALEGIKVEAKLKNLSPEIKVSTLEGVAPENHPANGTKETIKGWTLGGSVGLSAGGIAGDFNFGYTSSTSVSLPFSEMPATFRRFDNSSIQWKYLIQNPMRYHCHRGRNGGVNNYPTISTQDFSIEQTWCWVIDNTRQLQNQPLNLNIAVTYSITSGAATSGPGANHEYNFGYDYVLMKNIDLPTPDRYKDKVAVVASPVNSTSSYLRKLMSENSPRFRFLIDNPDRAGIVRDHLTHRLSDEWGDVYDELKRIEPFSGMDEEVTFTLQMSNGDRLPIGSTGMTGIHINKNGFVSMVK